MIFDFFKEGFAAGMDVPSELLTAEDLKRCERLFHEFMENRKNKALDKAKNAFWSTLADNLKEVREGDLTPLQLERIDDDFKRAFETWYDNNFKNY